MAARPAVGVAVVALPACWPANGAAVLTLPLLPLLLPLLLLLLLGEPPLLPEGELPVVDLMTEAD